MSMKETISQLIEKEQAACAISEEKENRYLQERRKINPFRTAARKAGDEYQRASMNIWYIFGLINDDGTRGKQEYTDAEKEKARQYYYNRRETK